MGGVAEKVSPDWNEEREFRYQTIKTYVQFMRELEERGYLKVVPLAQTGDYRRRCIILNLPGLRKPKCQ